MGFGGPNGSHSSLQQETLLDLDPAVLAEEQRRLQEQQLGDVFLFSSLSV